MSRVSQNADRALKDALLPYAIRTCTAKEMIYGGLRVVGLVQKPPRLVITDSSLVKCPTARSEINAVKLEYANVPLRMLPINVGGNNRYDMSIIRNQDVYRRFLKENRPNAAKGLTAAGAHIPALGLDAVPESSAEIEPAKASSSLADEERQTTVGGYANGSGPSSTLGGVHSPITDSVEARRAALSSHSRMYHVSKDALSILGADRVGSKTAAFTAQVKPTVPTMGSEVFNLGGERFMPLQMVKPVHHTFSPAQRTSGLTNPAGRLKQELLDRKGFGWQKKQRYLWQQDIATKGYRPDKFY